MCDDCFKIHLKKITSHMGEEQKNKTKHGLSFIKKRPHKKTAEPTDPPI